MHQLRWQQEQQLYQVEQQQHDNIAEYGYYNEENIIIKNDHWENIIIENDNRDGIIILMTPERILLLRMTEDYYWEWLSKLAAH